MPKVIGDTCCACAASPRMTLDPPPSLAAQTPQPAPSRPSLARADAASATGGRRCCATAARR
eukprot:6185399-Pleurochrysis_carterae.AAC.1